MSIPRLRKNLRQLKFLQDFKIKQKVDSKYKSQTKGTDIFPPYFKYIPKIVYYEPPKNSSLVLLATYQNFVGFPIVLSS